MGGLLIYSDMISPGRDPVEDTRPGSDLYALDTLLAFLTQDSASIFE
jgi:hypothetical protein